MALLTMTEGDVVGGKGEGFVCTYLQSWTCAWSHDVCAHLTSAHSAYAVHTDTFTLACRLQLGCAQLVNTLGEDHLIISTELQQACPDCAPW